MALHFILGGSGSGKSTFLFQNIIRQSIERPDRKYLVIVPEQSTLQTTRQIVMQHPAKGILNIDVLSFNRLSYRVIEQTGPGMQTVLTETGKNLVLRKAASQIRNELPWLGGRLDRQGYVSQVKSVLSELAQYEVSSDMLREMAEAGPDRSLLSMKLTDLARLKDSFDDAKRGLFITAEEVPALLAEHASESTLLKECVLAFDGFTGFTPVQMTAIRAMMRCADQIWISLTADPDEEMFGKISEHELFAMSKRTIRALSEMAGEEGIAIADPVCLDGTGKRFAPGSELAVLEKNLMRNSRRQNTGSRGSCGNTSDGKTVESQVRVRSFSDPQRECVFAASTIISLIHEKGYALKEIGVICSDLNTYAEHLSRAFDRNHIPYFIDRKEPVLMNPCLEFIRAALETAEKRFSYESVMRLVRTGFADVTTGEADLLETYLLAAGIRSWSGWKKTWNRPVRSLGVSEMETVNVIRERLVSMMEPFMKAFQVKEAAVQTYTSALRDMLECFSLKEKLQDDTMAPRGLTRSVSMRKKTEFGRVYECVNSVLTEAETLLGESRVSRPEFARILEAGFDQAKIGMLPAVLDQVYVGDLLRTRLGNIRVLLFMGMNEGLVPARSAKGGLLSAMDRELLSDEYGLRLSPSMREDAYTQRLYLYLNFTRPSDRLYLTWSESDTKGNPLRVSPVIREIRRILPDVSSERIGNDTLLTMDDAGIQTAQRLGTGNRSMPDRELNVLTDALQEGQQEKILNMARQGSAFICSRESITAQEAKRLYGNHFSGSVSRMDSFAACPFSHFLQYGLCLKEREMFAVRAADTGLLFHDALDRFGEAMSHERMYDWRTVSDEQASALVNDCVELSAQVLFQGLFSDTARNRFAAARVKDMLQTMVWGMLRRVRAGEMTPAFFETGFNEDEITGKIDRIDVCERDDQIYTAVIDYKSGSASFDLGHIYDGRSLQLPVYLDKAQRFLQKRYPGRNIIPAGIFYDHINQPVIKLGADEEPDQEDLERLMLGQMQLDGLLNTEPEAQRAFAEDEALRSLIVPVPKYNKDGSLRKNSPPAATQKQLYGLISFAGKKMSEQRLQIYEGNIRAFPYRDGKKMTCDYCPFRSVCSFDLRLPGAACRFRTGLEDRTILQMMEADV